MDWASDEGSGDIGAHDFDHTRLDVVIGKSFDVSIFDCIVIDVLCLSHI